MTAREWVLVRRLATIVLITALFPAIALAYRLFLSPEALNEVVPTATPVLYTLVPAPTNTAEAVTPKPTSLVVVVPNGWTEYPVSDQGFAVAIPASWQRLPVKQQELDASLQVIRQSNPELAAALGARSQQLLQSGVKFWAYDPDPDSLKSKFATNLTITRQTLPNEVSLDAYVLVNLNQINELSSRQGQVDHQRVSLGTLTAEKLRYNLVFQAADGTNVTSAITQYLLLNRSDAFVLTFATRLDQLDHYSVAFDTSADSFRVLGQ